jgi:glutamate racemase
MTNNLPIGLFDSGVGGTSIWREIATLMPAEDTIYLADSKNAPYGERSKEEIIALSIKNTEYLLDQNCKIIVVACNTATTNAIKELRSRYDIPFIGIEPALKPAVNSSATQTIGVLATKGTLSSELFNKAVESYRSTRIIEQIGHGLVPLIESGKINSVEMTELLQKYLQPMINENIDYLVLGCSHYPYLIPQIQNILPPQVKVIDSGQAVARQTKNVLLEKCGFADRDIGSHHFLINAEPTVLSNLLQNKYEVVQSNF